jgi:hypothetical protein
MPNPIASLISDSLPNGLNSITYDRRAGQYRGMNGRFVPRTTVMNLVGQETVRTEVRLKAQTRLMIQGKIDLAEWQTRMAQTIKDAHLRVGTLAAGGKQGMTPQKNGAIGYQLRQQYEYLDRFANDLAQGKLTPEQALRRSGAYSKSVTKTFHRIEKLTRQEEGFGEAKRSLDPRAKHCSSCIGYHTNGKWKPIDQVMLPGMNCECGQFCKCSIEYRYGRNIVAV